MTGYVIEPNRFDIDEDLGCTPRVTSSYVALLIVYIWPILCSSISAVYGGL